MKTSQTAIAKTLALLALLAVAIFVGFNSGTSPQNQEAPLQQGVPVNPIIISQVDFRFDVYCPIDSDERLAMINEVLGLNRSAINVNLRRNRNFYVVIAKAQPLNSTASDSSGALYYCGLARKWWEYDCQNAEIVCSIPGPMFRFQRQEKATIMWINDIYSQTVNWNPTECYSASSDNMFCTVYQKQLTEKCTYYKPTDYIYKTLTHRITKASIPISPHIHGLEVRPTFDGNPLGWFNTNGQKGPGYNTLLNQKYYCLFNNPTTIDGVQIDPQISKRSKIVKVANDQNPGMLFYHDHAMKSTKYNVANGLVGVYIIYDKYIESRLPRGPNQKVVVFAKQGDARVFVSKSGVTDTLEQLNENLYRIRMINAHFDDIFYNMTFSTYYQTKVMPDGSVIYKELDPTSSPDFDLTANQYKTPFTVIGTDGSLFRDPVYGIEQVSLGSAERVEILINFRQNMPAPVQFIYIVCYDNNEGKYVVKHRFSLPWNVKADSTLTARILKEQSKNIVIQQQPQVTHLATPTNTPIHTLSDTPTTTAVDSPSDDQQNAPLRLNVPFSDLSVIPDKQITAKRHRPLFSLPRDMNFMIGAHYMFESGATENPQIGTVEDFYIVNNLWQAHPIHFHLINFQTIRGYSLKQLPSNPQCTFYFLDFLRNSGLPQLQLNNAELCGYIWSLNQTDIHQIFNKMNNYSREDVIGSDRNSGLNTMALYDGNTEYLVDGCEFNTIYKYVCGNTTKDIEPYYRRWKDTSLVPAFSVFVLRVRWASNTYNPKVRSYPYFNIPEDDIIEFPGYVYHCHILPHQDNQMMRPIMLSHSDRYLQQQQKWRPRSSCSRNTWLATMKCINERMCCPA